MKRRSHNKTLGDRVDWESATAPTHAKTSPFLHFETANTYTLRLFANPKRIWRYYVNGRSAITDDPSTSPMKTVNPAIRSHARYVQIVLDRGDNGAVKIVEFSEKLFDAIARTCQKKGINPGSISAPDVIICVTGVGITIGYGIEFSTVEMPFTEEEKDRIRHSRQSGYDLDRIFRPTPNIADVLLGTDQTGHRKQAATS